MRDFATKHRQSGATLIEMMVAIGLLLVFAAVMASYLKNAGDESKLLAGQYKASVVLDSLDNYLELRSGPVFKSGTSNCTYFQSAMTTNFSEVINWGQNLVLNLANPTNLAPIPAGTIGAVNDMTNARNQCLNSLPSSLAGGTFRFCVVMSKATTGANANHVGRYDPAFAVVDARLVNVLNNSTVACPSFLGLGARAIEYNYQLYWLERVGQRFQALRYRGQFLASPERT